MKENESQIGINALTEALERKGIKAVLFDLDDTLTKTYFTEGRRIFKEALEELARVEIDEPSFMAEWYSSFRSLQAEFGVHPETTTMVAKMMADKYGVAYGDERLQMAYGAMWSQMYDVIPGAMPGAKETVLALRQAGLEVFVVTHGEAEWTRRKLSEWLDLIDGVVCVDVRKKKDSYQWGLAMQAYGVSPLEVMVVGDNLEADIKSASDLGVTHLFRVAVRWGKAEVLPEGVNEVMDLREILEVLMR